MEHIMLRMTDLSPINCTWGCNHTFKTLHSTISYMFQLSSAIFRDLQGNIFLHQCIPILQQHLNISCA